MMNRWLKVAAFTGLALAVPTLVNLAIARRRRAMLPGLPGNSGEYAWPLGKIAYQERGEGKPLVLVHGVGAGESSYEWRRNFEALSEAYHVYALDLPGFGESERRDIAYNTDIYITALQDFLRDIVGTPAYVMASSVSAAYAVKLAVARPELVERLVLLCPTGLETLRQSTPGLSQLAYGIFSLPALGEAVYNGIASTRYIESYLREHVYYNPARVTPSIVEHYYQCAHQSGGKFALRSFLAGLLNCDITGEYPKLRQPHLIVWGRQATMTPVENARRFLELNPRALLRVFETSRFLPHDEEAEEFNSAILAFLGTPASRELSSANAERALAGSA